jgi:hypothetical protein
MEHAQAFCSDIASPADLIPPEPPVANPYWQNTVPLQFDPALPSGVAARSPASHVSGNLA